MEIVDDRYRDYRTLDVSAINAGCVPAARGLAGSRSARPSG
jgi:hypothetical protein